MVKEQEDDQVVDRDETDPYHEVIFGRRRPDSIAVDWTHKVLYVLEFKRTSDQRQNYRERGEFRARAQHDVLVKSSKRWQEKQLERMADGKLSFRGGHVWISARTNIQQQSQGTWGCRLKKKHNPARSRARAA
jgi:hypothetical protein